jgi:hypothetical protein
MLRTSLAAVAATLLMSAPGGAFATDTTAAVPATTLAPVAAKAAKPSYADEVVCKTQIPTGSRLGGTKTCLTRAQWENQARDAGEGLSRIQADSKGKTGN